MSNRFYVNDVQIFGNNEMFDRTYEELKKQGAEWTEDGTFDEIEIKDPQALMYAVEKDSLEYLKKICTEDKPFEEVHDSDLILSAYGDILKDRAYTKQGEVREDAWKLLYWHFSSLRILESCNLYLAIKDDVDFDDRGNLILKKGHKIIACMH